MSVYVEPTTYIYATDREALLAAAAACGAPVRGLHYARTGSPKSSGFSLWTDRTHADRIADGLRLTGYRVNVRRAYTACVTITGAA